MHNFKPNDILYSVWGNGQTNVSFYVVTKTTKTTVTTRGIGTQIWEPGEYQDQVGPDLSQEGQEVRRKVQTFEGKQYLKRGSYRGAGSIKLWDGQAKIQTAFGRGR